VLVIRRFRRVVSPPLLIATVLVAGLCALVVGQVHATGSALADGHDRSGSQLLRLWQVRSTAADAYARRGMTLLAPEVASGPAADTAFRRLLDRPLTAGDVAAARRGEVRFGGLLADTVRGARGPAERAATLEILRRAVDLDTADAKVRREVRLGHGDGARRAALGEGGPSAGLDRALAGAITLEQRRVDTSMASARDDHGVDTALPLGCAALLVLVGAGVLPRLAEYWG
jgi:hypothetical protein